MDRGRRAFAQREPRGIRHHSAGGELGSDVPTGRRARTSTVSAHFVGRYRLIRKRISTTAPTATAYFSMVVSVGRVHTPLSRRDTTLLVVHIRASTSSCVIAAFLRAATRSATSTCNARSVLSLGPRAF